MQGKSILLPKWNTDIHTIRTRSLVEVLQQPTVVGQFLLARTGKKHPSSIAVDPSQNGVVASFALLDEKTY